MDAARGAQGHGWPFAPCPRSDDAAREPGAAGPDAGASVLVPLGRLPKGLAWEGETEIHSPLGDEPGNRISHYITNPARTYLPRHTTNNHKKAPASFPAGAFPFLLLEVHAG